MRRLLFVARATGLAGLLISGVLIVIGFGGSAEAGTATAVCGPALAGITGDANFKNPQNPPIVKEPILGAQQSCADDHLAHTVCGVADGLEKQSAAAAPIAGGIRSVNDGAAALTGHTCATTPPTTTPPGGGGGGKGGGAGAASTGGASAGGAGGGDAAVQGANAAADGSLPRTGGELFAGAGFGLMLLGTVARRFIR